MLSSSCFRTRPLLRTLALSAGLWVLTACGADNGAAGGADADAALPPGDPDPECSTPGESWHDRVCVEGHWRSRCPADGQCEGGASCCFGLCIPPLADTSFCDDCPCDDDALCAPRTASCDAYPFPTSVASRNWRLFNLTPYERVWAFGGPYPEVWPWTFASAEPLDVCAPPVADSPAAACFSDAVDFDDRRFVSCVDGALMGEQRIEYIEDGSGYDRPHSFARNATYHRDACGDVTVFALSETEYPYDQLALPAGYAVTVTHYEQDRIASCDAVYSEQGWRSHSGLELRGVEGRRWAYLDAGTANGTLEFDEGGRLVYLDVLGEQSSLSYDPEGKLESASVTYSGSGTAIQLAYTYDPEARSITETAADGTWRRLVFDAQQRPTRIESENSSAPWSYDEQRRLVQYGNVRYHYDQEECQAQAEQFGFQ